MLDSGQCIARYSRFKKKFIKSPHPAEKDLYVKFLIDLAKKERIQGWVIFPNCDDAVFVLSYYKEELEKYYRVPVPEWNGVQNVIIKKKTYQIAASNGIAVPNTFYPKDLSELFKLELSFPIINKPSIRSNFFNKAKKKAFLINSYDELKRIYQWACSIIDPSEILIQDFIPGGPPNLYSCCPFFKDGRIMVYLTARRARQHPMDFGQASTYVEMVDIPRIREIAENYLRLINFYGIAEVEFMK